MEFETFDIGDKVEHPKFKTGTVTFRTGDGAKQKLTVKFAPEVGDKKLLVEFAKLKRISERPTLAAETEKPAAPKTLVLNMEEDEDDDDPILDDEDEEEEEEEYEDFVDEDEDED